MLNKSFPGNKIKKKRLRFLFALLFCRYVAVDIVVDVSISVFVFFLLRKVKIVVLVPNSKDCCKD